MKNTVTFKQDIKAGNYQTNDITALLTSNVAGDGSQQFIFDFQTLQPISNVTIIPSFTSSANGLSVAFVDMSSPQDAIISEAWDFGDSTSISNTIGNQNHTYSSNGTYNVSLSAVNDSGSIFNFSNTITVSSVNQPPVAYFSVAINGLTVTIHDSSSDPENAALSEVLNWGDGSPSIEQVEGQTHTYVAGTYTITLTVTDPEGASSTYTKSVTLIDPNPQPAPGIPYNNNPTHLIEVNVTDGTGRIYSANATVGNDPTKPFQYKPLTDSNGVAHRGLTAHFYEDCVEVSVTRADAAYDEMNCHLTVTYDGVSAAVPPSSFVDGHVDFWRGCRMPAIRYGKQMAYDPNLIDWSVLPNYDRTPQTPYNESNSTYTYNGLGTPNQPAMGTTGERGEIGFLQQSNMAFLLEPNDQNWGVLRRCDDWAGQWSSVYYCDPVTGDILDVNTYPDACTLPLNQRAPHSKNPIAIYGGSYNGDVLTPPIDGWRMSASPLAPNGGHLTSYCMLTPMVCPTARDKDHCAFWANWTRLEINPSYTLQRGCMVGSQRRAAWCLRSLFLASYYSSHTQYFADEVARNLTIANAVVQNPFGLLATDIAYAGTGSATGTKGLAIWMQSYMMLTMDAVSNKLPEWKPFAQFCGKFYALIGALPQAPLSTIYTWLCADASNNLIYKYDANGAVDVTASLMNHLWYSLVDNGFSDDQATAITAPNLTNQDVYNLLKDYYVSASKPWSGQFINGIGDYYGAITSTDAYPAGDIMATIAAANVGTPGIAAALNRVQNLPTKPDYSTNQKYHLTLRNP